MRAFLPNGRISVEGQLARLRLDGGTRVLGANDSDDPEIVAWISADVGEDALRQLALGGAIRSYGA